MKKFILFITFLSIIYSCDDIIEVVDISNKTVTILAPTNNSIIDTTEVLFSWNTLEDAEHYQLQIATPNFTNASQILVDTVVTTTSYKKTLEIENYQWRVRAQNSDYKTHYITTSFTVEE